MIGVAIGELTMKAHDKVEVIDVYKTLKIQAMHEELSAITVIHLEEKSQYIASKDPLEQVLVGDDIYVDDKEQKLMRFFDMKFGGSSRIDGSIKIGFWVLHPSHQLKKSKMELKTFPVHLKYAFLGEDQTLSVILSASLSDE